MKKLSDIEISFISLVKSPANKKELIFKSGDKEPDFQKDIVLKSLSKDGVAYGIVYSPYEMDSQGEWSDEEEIKKAAWRFMQNKNIANIDKEHSFLNEKAFVCESWIIKSYDDIFSHSVGAWAVGIKINDEELKELIIKGEITGLSMAGLAKKEDEKIPNLMKGHTQMADEKKTNAKSEEETKVAELEAKIKELSEALDKASKQIEALSETLKDKDKKISEIKKSHKADLVERLVKSGEMLPNRKQTALELDGSAFDSFCEVCKSEAGAVLNKKDFNADSKKSDELDPELSAQIGLKRK